MGGHNPGRLRRASVDTVTECIRAPCRRRLRQIAPAHGRLVSSRRCRRQQTASAPPFNANSQVLKRRARLRSFRNGHDDCSRTGARRTPSIGPSRQRLYSTTPRPGQRHGGGGGGVGGGRSCWQTARTGPTAIARCEAATMRNALTNGWRCAAWREVHVSGTLRLRTDAVRRTRPRDARGRAHRRCEGWRGSRAVAASW